MWLRACDIDRRPLKRRSHWTMIGPVVRRISSSIFVGRVVERARLEASLEAAQSGEPGLVLIGGEAGIGKTRLAGELTAAAGTRKALVVTGQCLEAKAAGVPFAPFIEILRGLLLRAGADGQLRAAGAGRDELARLVPEIGPQPASESRPSTEDERIRLFYAVLELFGRMAEERTLLVLVEDLHWADASSLDMLRFIAGGLRTQHFLLVGSFRTDELHRRHPLLPLLGELVRLPHVMRIDVPPFTAAEVADQVTGITGTRPPEDVVTRVSARSDGNPFFVEELTSGTADASLPGTLRDILASRLGTLSPDARWAVLAAAAIGREAPETLIAHVAALSRERLVGALREAIDRHVLVADSRSEAGLVFRHALIQELAYAELLPSERVAMHRAVATSLQNAGGSAGEIARHAFLGHDLPSGLIYSVRAAEQAIDALAFAEALTHFERALELWATVPAPESTTGRDQASLLMLAAGSAGALGRWNRAVDLQRTALTLLDPIARRHERIAALLDLSRWEMLVDEETARAATVHAAAELIATDPPTPLRARVLTELAHLANHHGRTNEARRLAQEALEMSRAIRDRAEEARAIVRLSEAASNLMQPDAADKMLVEAGRIASDGHVPFDDFAGYLVFRRVTYAAQTGAFARAIELADWGMERAARAGRFGERSGFLRADKISALAALGRWDEAEALVEAERRDGATVTSRMAIQNFLRVLIRQGRIDQAALAVRATDYEWVIAEEGWQILEARIRLANAEGRWDDARAAADEAMTLFEDPTSDLGVLVILELCVGAEADRADLARGRRRLAEAAEARRVGLARLDLGRGPVQAAIRQGGAGQLVEATLATAEAEGSRLEGRSDPALWEEVARRCEALAEPWETAYALFRWAEAILATTRGHRNEVLPLLREAHDKASQLGAPPLVAQIEGLARRGRIRLAAATPERRVRRATTQDGVVVELTTREWEVLSLVAGGHTNREIGDALFISEKTASVHITNAMDKLGALSRYDAAASATRLGLLDATTAASHTR
jgi:DNA-binding NarL/FixJ family response regulator